jgi:hypothetical protein
MGVNLGSTIEGPSKKKKKVQKRTQPPHPSLVRDVTESMNVVHREVRPEVVVVARAEIYSEGLEDLILRSLLGATPPTTFTTTEKGVPEPKEAVPDARAEDFKRDVGTPTQMAAIEDSASQFCLLEECPQLHLATTTDREDLRSPQLSCNEAERSQGLSVIKGSKASSHQGEHNLEIKPSQEIDGEVSPAY